MRANWTVDSGRARLLRAAWLLAVPLATASLRAQEAAPATPPPAQAVQATGGDQAAASDPAVQPPDTTDTPALPTAEELRQRLATLTGVGDLTDEVKKSLADLFGQAADAMTRAESFKADAARFQTRAALATDRVAEIRATIAGMPSADEAALVAEARDMSLADVEQRSGAADAALATARSGQEDVRTRLEKLQARPEELTRLAAEARAALDRINEELKNPPPPGEPAVVTEARLAALRAKQSLRQLELASYEQERATYEQRLALLGAEADLATRDLTRLENVADAWRQIVQDRRQQEARLISEEAEAQERQAGDMPPAVRELASVNTELAKRLEQTTISERQVGESLQRTRDELAALASDFEGAQQRIELGGLNESVGLVLREQRDSLPDLRSYRRNASERRRQLGELSLAKIDVEEQRRGLSIDKETERIAAGLDPSLSTSGREAAIAAARQLLTDRVGLLQKLGDGYDRLFRQLRDIDTTEKKLLAEAEEFDAFISEHLLWIRSTGPIRFQTFRDAAKHAAELVSPSRWRRVGTEAIGLVVDQPLLWAAVGGLLALLTFYRRRARRVMKEMVVRVGRVKTDSFSLTAKALLASLVLATPVPVALAFVGWQWWSGAADGGTRALGIALIDVAVFWALFSFARWLFASYGLAKVHFGWREQLRLELRRALPWWMLIVLPAVLLVVLTEHLDDSAMLSTIGRIAFMTAMMAAAAYVGWLLRPSGPVMRELVRLMPNAWVTRLRLAWYPLVVAIPISLLVLAALGYVYTAVSLNRRLEATVWIILGLFLLYSLVIRWLRLNQRRLAYEAELQRRLAARKTARKAELAPAEAAATEDAPIEIDESELDIGRATASGRRLVSTGFGFAALVVMWMLWSDMLPALGMLERIELWQSPTVVDGVETMAPVTAANLLGALIVAVITTLAARHLPGTLEILVLARLPIDAGARYASTTLCRYAIVGIGVIVAFNTLGLSWSSIQWLVAALSVGLGFGLQEIVANFVSGIIILFERPFRVGDIVTVGEVNGYVSKIRIRATTIVDWDRRELVVPNKRFITSEFMNSTLSDKVGRIRIAVGIAYGTDVPLAKRLLMEAAESHELVLKDPGPSALFVGFGADALNVELRAFVGDINTKLGVTDQLYLAIDEQFKRAGIEIVFPQRDVHLTSTTPLDVRVVGDGTRDVPDEAARSAELETRSGAPS